MNDETTKKEETQTAGKRLIRDYMVAAPSSKRSKITNTAEIKWVDLDDQEDGETKDTAEVEDTVEAVNTTEVKDSAEVKDTAEIKDSAEVETKISTAVKDYEEEAIRLDNEVKELHSKLRAAHLNCNRLSTENKKFASLMHRATNMNEAVKQLKAQKDADIINIDRLKEMVMKHRETEERLKDGQKRFNNNYFSLIDRINGILKDLMNQIQTSAELIPRSLNSDAAEISAKIRLNLAIFNDTQERKRKVMMNIDSDLIELKENDINTSDNDESKTGNMKEERDDSVEVIDPPAALTDLYPIWDTALKCETAFKGNSKFICYDLEESANWFKETFNPNSDFINEHSDTIPFKTFRSTIDDKEAFFHSGYYTLIGTDSITIKDDRGYGIAQTRGHNMMDKAIHLLRDYTKGKVYRIALVIVCLKPVNSSARCKFDLAATLGQTDIVLYQSTDHQLIFSNSRRDENSPLLLNQRNKKHYLSFGSDNTLLLTLGPGKECDPETDYHSCVTICFMNADLCGDLPPDIKFSDCRAWNKWFINTETKKGDSITSIAKRINRYKKESTERKSAWTKRNRTSSNNNNNNNKGR